MSGREIKLNIPLANRYSGAWSEIVQRVGARQSVYLQFATVIVTAVSGVLGAWLKYKDDFLIRTVAEWGGSAGLTVYTWVFALWIGHNDALIGLLAVFCRTLEELDDASGLKYPGWQIEAQGWTVLGRKHRRKSDLAAALLALLVCLLIAFFAGWHLWHCEPRRGLGLSVALGFEIWALAFLAQSGSFRKKISGYDDQTVRDKAAKLHGKH